jgi:putative ABC transport system substrate-binding protein
VRWHSQAEFGLAKVPHSVPHSVERRVLLGLLGRSSPIATVNTNLNATLLAKRLGLLHELIPAAHDIAVLHNKSNPGWEINARDIQAVAKTLGVEAQALFASTVPEIETAFAALSEQPGPRVLLINNDQFFATHYKDFAALATSYSIPAMFFSEDFVRAGGLIGYSSPRSDTFRQVGGLSAAF